MQRRDGIRAIERAMFEIARSLGRRDLGRHVERRLGKPVDGSHLLVVDAIDDGAENGEPPTVGKVAKVLDVHPSRASRMVKSAIRAGLALRVASQGDGRKSCLELSARGREIVKALRSARARYFAARMKGWPRADRRHFARLLVLFAQNDHSRHVLQPGNDNAALSVQGEPRSDLAGSARPATSKRRTGHTAKRTRNA
ncbi:MAG TPA: MarR family transcriptional regulator [Rhizomicrobium sp.]|nr:MarR family transcriptional regulator [Rhizomicrobium sp.]